MEPYLLVRFSLALLLASYLSYHGISKKSLDISGAIAAVLVGFLSFACSYRFGFILILFYYTSSKFTKYKETVKCTIEENYAKGGQRNYLQVFASSLLATIAAVCYYYCCGEDSYVTFGIPEDPTVNVFGILSISSKTLSSYLWVMYIAHYATATADTWASELGVLSKSNPRLVTSLFLKQVPPGTNGGMSLIGTLASAAGGLFIGLIFWVGSLIMAHNSMSAHNTSQFPAVIFGLVCGTIGSLIDSLLGATLQATYYSSDRKCIVKHVKHNAKSPDSSIKCICGVDLLSNEAVNLLSILLTMILSVWIAPNIFCMCDSSQCHEAFRLNKLINF